MKSESTKPIQQFINALANENFAEAKKFMKDAVEIKLKERVKASLEAKNVAPTE